MLKNAKIKSKAEATRRLIAGEIFYLDGNKIYYDEMGVKSPFRFETEPLFHAWDDFEEWLAEVPWYEDLGEGVLCKVWDENSCAFKIRLVTMYNKNYREYPFTSDNSVRWKHATPLSLDEITKFIKG